MTILKTLQVFAYVLAGLGILEWLRVYSLWCEESITSGMKVIGVGLSALAVAGLSTSANRIAKRFIGSDSSSAGPRDKDHICLVSASLLGFVGMISVLIEVAIDLTGHSEEFGFVLEEVLLGFSGLFMLIEEYRLLNINRIARNDAEGLLAEITLKHEETSKLHKEVVHLHGNVEGLHGSIKEKLDQVGPAMIAAVKNIFGGNH